ncbi:AsnC family transcriptional regulator [Halogeometricum borinquense]|uniref:AsnC family transcriptional regulator n=1 Tax=Halogeometricum borinquense TaxID=60847 RepID=A0A6C0UKH5_9EURY|nr:AsnC family transcriptional regulator [Halogeometricum borinquense]QIB75975.1 AsnC family transcriptional regulator [Halogeometricum borinquense]QIQ75443.1 AsnC family transcriptional regulator [Halogeometricum borinquense]
MRELDETDLQILELLTEDARRPFSDIAEQVDLSPPAVSDRVDKLRESGVIRRFTLDLDRSQLRAGVPVLVRLDLPSTEVAAVTDNLRESEGVEHVFVTVEGDVVFSARFRSDGVREGIDEVVDLRRVTDYDVTIVSEMEWVPSVGGTEFALTCAECGNTVTSEGESDRIGGNQYHFCCPSCAARFREQYERFSADAE